MKEIAGLECRNAKIVLARIHRFISMPVVCEAFIVPYHEYYIKDVHNYVKECTYVTTDKMSCYADKIRNYQLKH